MADIVKVGGMITFSPHDKAPEFVLGNIVIDLDRFYDWLEAEGRDHITEWKGKKQLKLQVTSMKGKRGILVAVDTFVPKPKEERTGNAEKQPKWDGKKEEKFNANSDDQSDLPF